MKNFQIESKAGLDMGTYSALNEAHAILIMLRDGGMSDDDVWLNRGELEYSDDDYRKMGGSIEDWNVVGVSENKYVIKNDSGQYWTGKCFGVEQAAEVYESFDSIPTEIDGMEANAFCDDPEYPDVRYYADDTEEPVASVFKI